MKFAQAVIQPHIKAKKIAKPAKLFLPAAQQTAKSAVNVLLPPQNAHRKTAANIHIQHYPTMQIPNLATAAATKAKNTAANPATPTATASV